ncbi:KWG Leptospira [Caballeronia arvi]|uniref:KWG Leptospira n=1 Tax=Caballeronia arvi TaxID=1777135 RepID=A0A158L433_9BURK|nr:WG repeat-containing protein [Caballeronia arvi]SAL87411.1 KWG Leptospira [Caballeronia arvi]
MVNYRQLSMALALSTAGLVYGASPQGGQVSAKPDAIAVPATRSGTYVVTPRFDNAGAFSEGLAAVQVGDKWGFIDRTGSLVIKPQFNPGQAQYNAKFADGLAAVNFQPGGDGARWGFIDKRGAVVINPQFDGDYYTPPFFSEGRAAIKVGARYGYIDKTGSFVIAPMFDEARWFSEGLAVVKTGGKYGYVDRAGMVAIQPTFDSAGAFKDGLAVVTIGGRCGFINRTGVLAVKPQFELLDTVSDGLAQFAVSNPYHTDEKGQVAQDAPAPQDDGAWKYGYVDRTGRVVIAPQFELTLMNQLGGSFVEGLAVVEFGTSATPTRRAQRGKFGFIDKAGRLAINPQYDFASSFSDGLAVVEVDGKYGYIDHTGNMIIEAQFEQADSFSEGLAWVRLGTKFGFIRR